MDSSDLAGSFEIFARRLDEAGIPWAVFAGAAAAVYGATWPLTDVDILVPMTEGERVAALFPDACVKMRKDGDVTGIQLPDIDILAGLMWSDARDRGVLDLDEQMVGRLIYHKVAGVMAPVIPLEDNILLKAVWGRGPEVGKHDWEDVQAMLDHVSALGWTYLRWRAQAYGPPEHVQSVLERIEALWRGPGMP